MMIKSQYETHVHFFQNIMSYKNNCITLVALKIWKVYVDDGRLKNYSVSVIIPLVFHH